MDHMSFEWIRNYDANYELRVWGPLIEKVQRRPVGSFRPLLGARRSGKTWALKALRSAVGERGIFLDLRDYNSALPTKLEAEVVLVDEPGLWIFEHDEPEQVRRQGLRVAPGRVLQLLNWCRDLRQRDVAVTMALTSAEWSALLDAGGLTRIVEPEELERGRLGPLERRAASKIARTPEAQRLFEQLPEVWTRSPFLLNLILDVGLDDPGGFVGDLSPEQFSRLEELAIQRALDSTCNYDYHVIYQGLTLAQRDIVRAVCRGRRVQANDDCRLLERMGLLWRQADSYVPGDPILAATIPPVLRIHHISDLHFGAASIQRIDAKDRTVTGRRLAAAAGQGPVVEDYYDWLQSRSPSERPHLLIVSGDVAEQARDSEYEAARAWLEKVAETLAPHAGLTSDDPRVLLVPGNHDVDWNEPPSRDGERRRHMRFASAFGTLPWLRPQLEQPPGERDVASHFFKEADLEVLLLGSCEYGGLRDLGIEQVADRIMDLAKEEGNLTIEQTIKDIKGSYGRQDPGFVHNADIQTARRHPWSGRVRIAVLHHPLSPIPSDGEIAPRVGLQNAGQLKGALLEKHFCLALHGHVHSPWVATERWHGAAGGTLLICSAHTLGSYPAAGGNGFNEICILQEGQHYAVEVQPFVRRDRTSFAADGEPIRVEVPEIVAR
jgi:3',5'-cyclic AMP phosphodiesterase CpdA